MDGDERVHLAHKVAPQSSLDQIAAEFGVNKSTVMRLNGINDSATLQASQILDVPLRGKRTVNSYLLSLSLFIWFFSEII